MILPTPTKADFDFRGKIQADVGNQGFTADELRALAGPPPGDFLEGKKAGAGEWFERLWKKNRQVPPEIQNLKSEFGYQSNPFLTDLREVAQAQGTKLDGLIQARANYNFYIMRCGVYISPNGGEKFEALKFELQYQNPQASTFSMLPGPLTDKLFELGGTADIGVTGKFDFGFPPITVPSASIDASAKAKLDANFVVSFHYELKSQIVDAFGMGSSFCRWFLHRGDKLRNDVVFYPIIMTPKSVTEFPCEFRAFFQINHSSWKNAEFFLKPPMTTAVSV